MHPWRAAPSPDTYGPELAEPDCLTFLWVLRSPSVSSIILSFLASHILRRLSSRSHAFLLITSSHYFMLCSNAPSQIGSLSVGSLASRLAFRHSSVCNAPIPCVPLLAAAYDTRGSQALTRLLTPCSLGRLAHTTSPHSATCASQFAPVAVVSYHTSIRSNSEPAAVLAACRTMPR